VTVFGGYSRIGCTAGVDPLLTVTPGGFGETGFANQRRNPRFARTLRCRRARALAPGAANRRATR